MSVAPLVKTGLISGEVNLALAGLIGIGFGFMLERAGFGNANRVALQWQARDWSVFRVMFTAIVTAMFGIILLDQTGIMPFGSFYILKTYLGSQIIGGALLGAGMAIGGYCPGTSTVAMASGKIDAIYFIFGMSLGTFMFAEVDSMVGDISSIGAKGRVTLNDVLDLDIRLIGFIALAILISGTLVANAIERKFNK